MATTEDQATRQIKAALATLARTDATLRKTGEALTAMLTRGAALCADLRQYNLDRMAVYNAQAAWLSLLAEQGIAVPMTPPFPTLFQIAGQTGVASLQIDCAKLPKFVSTTNVRIITGADQMFPGSEFPTVKEFPTNGQLGAAPVVLYLIIAGIAIAVTGAVVITISDNMTARGLEESRIKALEVRAQTHSGQVQARMTCNDRCLAKIDNPTSAASINTCATTCDKLLPKIPDDFYKDGQPKEGGSKLLRNLGIFTLCAAATVGGVAAYRRIKARREAA